MREKSPASNLLSNQFMNLSSANGRRGRQRGSAIVEFALTLVPMLALLFLTIDLSWMLFAWACIQEGVREGVRYATTGHTDAEIQAVVQTYSFGFVKNVGTQTQICPNSSATPIQVCYYSAANPSQSIAGTSTTCSGNIVKVSVTGINLAPLGPIWRSKSPITLSGVSADLVESNSTCR